MLALALLYLNVPSPDPDLCTDDYWGQEDVSRAVLIQLILSTHWLVT